MLTKIRHDLLPVDKSPEINFELIKQVNGSCLLVDFELGLVKVEWHGIVDLESSKAILTLATDLITIGNCNKLLVDRQHLEEFTIEARVWIKFHFWPSKERKLVSHTYKFAAIGSVAPKESFFDNFLSKRVKHFFPWVRASTFYLEEDALNWIQ